METMKSDFGPSKDEIWGLMTDTISAELTEDAHIEGSKAEFKHGEWTITLDSYTTASGAGTTVYTRIRAPYVNRDGFRFSIYESSLFSHIGNVLGAQDVEIGDKFFDEDYVIKATDEEKVKELLADSTLRELIAAQPDIHFSVRDDEGWFGVDFPDGVDELCFECTGLIRDEESLKQLYDLFARCLDQLCKIGSAYATDPGIDLS